MKRYLKRILFALLAVTVWGGGSYAQDVFDFPTMGYSNAQDVTNVVGTNCTLAFSTGEGTITPKYYNTGTGVRLYSKNTLTISSANQITEIVFEFTVSGNTAESDIEFSAGTFDGDSKTWTGDATEVVVTNTASSGHFRIQKITVTTSGEAKEPTSLSFGEGIDNNSIAVIQGEESGFSHPTATLSPAVDGATITYESDNLSVASVDESTGEITFGELGTATITARFAGNDTYAASSLRTVT